MNWIRFCVTEREALRGSVVYKRDEDSFQFRATSSYQLNQFAGDAGVTSLLVEYLQIETAVTGGIGLFVWGYHPRSIWTPGTATPTGLRPACVTALIDGDFTPGVSERIVDPGEWVTVFDPDSGWVRVTPDAHSRDEQILAIADQTGIGLIGERLNSIWLQPTFEP